MGNYKFRFSDMMPNAWFYKLKDMNKPSKTHHTTKKKQPPTTAAAGMVPTSKTSKSKEQNQLPNPSRPRKSYYFTRDLNLVPNDDVFSAGKTHNPAADSPDPPRKSAKQRTRKRDSKPSPKMVSADCSCRPDSLQEYSYSPLDTSPEQNSGDENGVSTCSCRVDSKLNSIVIEVDEKSFKTQLDKLQDDLDSISDLHHLPPIITKHSGEKRLVQEQRITKPNTPARKSSAGVRLRVHSPKIASKKIQSAGRRSISSSTTSSSSSRRSISDSCAVVKSSFDPQRDFKESMMEMIIENNLRASKDLEDLLACYLSLNSDEYHELIIKVFKQIWFDLSDLKFK